MISASPNGDSLVVEFEAILDGCVGAMPLLREPGAAPGDYRNVMTGRPVTVERIGCDNYRPDHNGECLNCDEPADAHDLPET